MREAVLRWLLGGDAKSWKELLTIATESNEQCRNILEREKNLIERYGVLVDRENAILDAVVNSSDMKLKLDVIEILKKSAAKMEEATNEIIR